MAVLLWQGSAIITLFFSGSVTVVVGERQAISIDIHDVQYVFVKEGNGLGIYPWDSTKVPTNAILSPQEGETYPWLSIDITIAETHPDRYVLVIKSRD